MDKGTIARLMGDKGYGFIKRDDGQKDLFFHAKELSGLDHKGNPLVFEVLNEGDAVTFEIGSNEKGQHAMNVALA